MGATGTTTVDFGAFPGGYDTTKDIASAGIISTSLIESWILPVATADHSIDEHMLEPLKIVARYLSDGNLRIHAFNMNDLIAPAETVPPGAQQRMTSASVVAWTQLNRQERPTGTLTLESKVPRVYGLYTVAWAWV